MHAPFLSFWVIQLNQRTWLFTNTKEYVEHKSSLKIKQTTRKTETVKSPST